VDGLSLTTLTFASAAMSFAAGLTAIGIFLAIIVRERALIGKLHGLISSREVRTSLLTQFTSAVEALGQKIALRNKTTLEIRTLLAAAGFYKPSAVYSFLVIRIAITLTVFLCIIAWRGDLSLFSLLIASAFAILFYRYSLIAVKYVGERRAARIQRELPPVLDIVLMVLDSGVSIDQCLQYVARSAQKSAPTVAPILKQHVADVESGLPYDQALTRLGQRLAVPEGADFAALLNQAMFQGGELAPSLRRFSDELSDNRLARARSEGGRRATYLTMTMVTFFVPVLVVILVGPAFISVASTVQAAAQRIHSK